MEPDEGWHDPWRRNLRTISVLVILALLCWTVVVKPGPTDLVAIGTLIGPLLVILGLVQDPRPPKPRGGRS